MPEGFDRQKLIEEKVRETESRAVTSLALIREIIRKYLLNEKFYSQEDIEHDKEFKIAIDDYSASTSVDYIIKLNGKRFMAIKCSPGALESRERHLISFARVVDSYQIPFAVVTDGFHARMLDAVSGKLISEGLDSIPGRPEAIEILKGIELTAYPSGKIEREKRILLAFDAIKCTEE